jgi:hypothetical protein
MVLLPAQVIGAYAFALNSSLMFYRPDALVCDSTQNLRFEFCRIASRNLQMNPERFIRFSQPISLIVQQLAHLLYKIGHTYWTD